MPTDSEHRPAPGTGAVNFPRLQPQVRPITPAELSALAERVPPLVRDIEHKDASTAAHTWRVVLYTRAMGEAFGLDDALLRRISFAAALHDLGKLDVPDEILKKPGRLTDTEFAVIKRHPLTGWERLRAMGVEDPAVLALVRWHHERIDGRGYPDGLSGEDIPLGPRFFSVIDTFDALTSVRPYRAEVGEEAAEIALAELERGVGTRYCAEAVDRFTELFRSGSLGWILNYFNDQVPAPAYRPNGA